MSLHRSGTHDVQLLGVQEPRILVAPAAATSAADEAIEYAASVGLDLDPWQCEVLRHALGETDGAWAAFEVGLCVPRQNGKSALAEARMLAGLFCLDEELIVYSAHQFDTAMETMRRLELWLERSGERYKPNRSNGKEGIELATGQRVKFKARSKGGGRGFSGDCVILDEAMILDSSAIGALMPTLSAMPNPQLWYLGSAADQEVHDKCSVFTSVRQRAIDRTSPRLCYIEFGCEDGADPTDRANWARANPALGRRITAEYIEDEYQAMIHTPKIFAVERLGIGDWPKLGSEAARPIPDQVWTDLTDTTPALLSPYPRVVGVDRTPLSKVWSVAGAQRRRDGGVHLEIGFNAKATVTDMVAWLERLVTDADPIALVIDQKSPAIILEPYLKAAGIEPVTTNTSELTMACGGLLEAADAELMSHSGQKVLDDSIAALERKELPGGFVWKPVSGGVIAPAVAATVAHWGLLSFDRPARASLPPMATQSAAPTAVDGLAPLADFDAMAAAF